MEFGVDTLWAVKRFGSSGAESVDGVRCCKGLGKRARLVVKDDVLVMWRSGSHNWRGRMVAGGGAAEFPSTIRHVAVVRPSLPATDLT